MKPEAAEKRVPSDPTRLKVAREAGRSDILFGLARVPLSATVYVGSSDGRVYQVDLSAEKPEPSVVGQHASYVTSVAWTGEFVVSGSYDCRLCWWKPPQAEPVRSIEAHSKWIRQVVVSPDGGQLASVADDMVCRIWDAATGQLLHELQGHAAHTPHHFPSMLYAAAYSPDGRWLATGDRAGQVVVWDSQSGSEAARVDASGVYTWDPTARRHSIGGIRSLAFSPDGERLAVGGMGKVSNIDHPDAPARLEVFRWRQSEALATLQTDGKFKGMFEQLAWHPDGDWLVGAGGGYAGLIAFFDPQLGKILFQDSAPMRVHGLSISESGDVIFASGHNKLLVWQL